MQIKLKIAASAQLCKSPAGKVAGAESTWAHPAGGL